MNEIVALTAEAQAQKVVELMFKGSTKKDACLEAGISIQTFDRFVATNPLFVADVQATIRSNFASFMDEIQENRAKNLASILEFSEALRDQMKHADNMEDAIKAFQALVKLEGQLAKTMDHILPTLKEVASSGPEKIEPDAALALLAQLNGADLVKVTKTTTVELAHPEVVEASVS